MRTVFPAFTVFAAAGALLALNASSAHAQVAGFTDIPKDHWAADSVAKLASAGIVKGNSAAPLGEQNKGGAPRFDGNRAVTRYELAVTLYRFVQYIQAAEQQPKGKLKVQAAPAIDGPTAVKRLIAQGYLPENTPLATDGNKLVTANQLADALSQVVSKDREKRTPITPDSQRTLPVEKPTSPPAGA